MTTTQATTATISTTMFGVSDQDSALAYYTEQLGWELRADVSFGPDGEYRWLEVAPPASVARLALCPPMNGAGNGSLGLDVDDVLAEHARLTAIGGLDVDPEPMVAPGAPVMFALRDPDGNHLWFVGTS